MYSSTVYVHVLVYQTTVLLNIAMIVKLELHRIKGNIQKVELKVSY